MNGVDFHFPRALRNYTVCGGVALTKRVQELQGAPELVREDFPVLI